MRNKPHLSPEEAAKRIGRRRRRREEKKKHLSWLCKVKMLKDCARTWKKVREVTECSWNGLFPKAVNQ